MRHNRDDEPRRLHEPRHGHTERGRYTMDSHFNPGYGEAADNYYGDHNSYYRSADQEQFYPDGQFQSGGATYSGEDFTRNRNVSRSNPYGMIYTRNDGHNSGRHYDARADYSNRDYNDLRHNRSHDRYRGMPDERFGHDVRSGGRKEPYTGHSSIGDYESYRRYEYNNRAYDNDYSGGFAGRNHTEGRDHFGEDTYYSNLDRWSSEREQRSNDKANRRKKR